MDSRKLSGFLYKNAQMGLYTIPMLLSISKDKRFNALLRQQYAFYRSFAKQTAKLPREKDILSLIHISLPSLSQQSSKRDSAARSEAASAGFDGSLSV